MIDRDLTCYTELAVAVSDSRGILLASSAKHAARLGRPVDGVVGRHWREYVFPEHHPRGEVTLARVLAGDRTSTILTILRPDGRLATSRVNVFQTRRSNGEAALMSVSSTMLVSPLSALSGPGMPSFDVTTYVAALAEELAKMATRSGMIKLSDSLEAVAGQAGDTAARFERDRQ